jgi:phosphoserine phosphatase RsbU/P
VDTETNSEYMQDSPRRISSGDLWAVGESRLDEEGDTPPGPLQEFAELRILRAVMDSLSDALIVLDTAGNVVMSNPAARKVFCTELDNMKLSCWRSRYVVYKKDRTTPYPPEERPFVRVLNGEAVDVPEAYLTDSDTGTSRWVSITARPLLDESGQVQGAFAIFHDISQRKQIEETLLIHDRAMGSASEGITIADATRPGRPVIYVNGGFESITGYSAEEFMRGGWKLVQGPDTSRKALDQVHKAVERELGYTADLVNYRKNGERYWCRMSIMPVRDEFGRLTHYVGVHSDITAQKQTEERLRAARDELRAHNEHFRRNLDAAVEVQRALLPSDLPDYDWGKVAWRLNPCDELAGDILSIFPLDENHYGLYVIDVCGHGVAAALLSVTVRRFLSPSYSPSSMVMRRAGMFHSRRFVPPAEVADQLNKRFAWDANRGQFFTLVYGVLNVQNGDFRYVTAGHPPPIRFAGGDKAVELPGRGFPIGISDEPYKEHSVRLLPGDRILLYSDGAGDVMDQQRTIFGSERLAAALAEAHRRPLDEALSYVLERLDAWRGPGRIRDDITLLALEMARNGKE